jgi:hypothetical protein
LNLRDLGGLPMAADGLVQVGRLYRSDAPIAGDPQPPLRPWPPSTVVDLRSPGEAASPTHPLASPTTEVMTIPLLARLDPARLAQGSGMEGLGLGAIYLELVRSATAKLVEVVTVVATSPGPVLLHCSAGKDRTGVATAVVLAAAGVPRDAIVADYLRTEASLEQLPQRLARGWSEPQRKAMLESLVIQRPDLMRVSAAAITGALDELSRWPGSTVGWLLDHGLGRETLTALRRRLAHPTALAAGT